MGNNPGREEKENPDSKKDDIADANTNVDTGTDTWDSGCYYFNGIHSEDYPNGAHYDSEWLFGKFHGNGMLRWKNGDVYEGEYQNDKRR